MSKLLVISLLIIALILGIGIGYMITPEYVKQSAMHSNNFGNADEKYDERFIDGMVKHHEGAIEMAKDAQQKSSKTEILNLSQKIINAQEKEIEQMKEWKAEWYGKNN